MSDSWFKEQLFSFKWWRSWINIVIGAFLVAAGYVLFINPYHIVPGGVYGAGVVLHYMFPGIQVGTFGLMLDIPLMLLGFRIFGGMFGARTVVAALLTPVFMNSLTMIVGEDPVTMFGGNINLSNDLLVSCIFGGVIIGAGVGLVVRTRATTGGTDIVGMIITKYTGIKFARAVMMVDSLIVVFGIIAMGNWEIPLYSLVAIFVTSRMIDFVIDGASYDKLLFIITDNPERMKSFILDEMGRGATYIKSKGMYTNNDKDMIFLVVSRREVTAVQSKIKEIDPASFVVVVDAYETFGDGFKTLPDKE
jgi:uncharacterized membrane-anchored protein YitT (DUF2179 family)